MSAQPLSPEDRANRWQPPIASAGDKRDPVSEGTSRSEGLFRATLAGPGRSLAEAFANLEHSPHVDRLVKHAERDIVAGRVTLTPDEGDGYWELTRIRDDFYVIILNFLYKTPQFEFVPGDGLVQFNFKLSGDLNYGVSQPPLRFNRPALHVWRQPQGIDMHEWTAPHSHERQVAISVHPEFLANQFLTPGVDVPPQLQAFVSDQNNTVCYYQLPLSAEMFAAASRMIKNPFSGIRSLLYTEAVTLELLCSAVDGFYSLPAASLMEEYSERTLRSLQMARSLLMRQISSPPTLRQLARAVGLAETSLTRGFKALYSETVFEFSLRCRMQHALKLLRDQHQSVDMVSEAIGYSHPTSFSTAFRRYFKMRPIEVRHAKAK